MVGTDNLPVPIKGQHSRMAEMVVVQTKPVGYNLFDQKEKNVYDAWVEAGSDETLTMKERQINRGKAAKKLKNVINERGSATDLEAFKAEKQAILDRRELEIAYGASLLSAEGRLAYYAWIVEATDPETSVKRRDICNNRATEKADKAAKKQAEIDKRAAMTTDELKIYNNSKEVVWVNVM